MNEARLVEMMSFLDPELLEDDFIEKDMNRFANLFSRLTQINPKRPLILKIITFIIAGILLLVGIITIIIKKKKPKLSKKIFKLATN